VGRDRWRQLHCVRGEASHRRGHTRVEEDEAMNISRIRPLELAVIVCGAWGLLAGPVSLVVWLMGGK